jgi:hypothetical protein
MNFKTWPIAPVLAGMLFGACSRGKGEATPPEAAGPANLSDADYPGTLAPTLSGPDFLARQRLDGKIRDRTIHGEAVLQKQGEALTLIGMTPFGTKAFVAKQQGGQVENQVFAPEGKLPFPPRFMLLDINRVLFLGLPGAPLADGTHFGQVGEETVTEKWQGGALLERTFARKDGEPAGTIVIVYEGGMQGGKLPERLRLDNQWFGYTIVIDTIQWQPL